MLERLRHIGEWMMQVRVFAAMIVIGVLALPLASWIGIGRRSYYVGDTLVLIGILVYFFGAVAGILRLRRWLHDRGEALFVQQKPFTKFLISVAIMLTLVVVGVLKYREYFGPDGFFSGHH